MSSSGWKEYKFSEILSTPLKNGVNKPTKVRGDGYKMVNMGELFANPIIRNMEMARVPMTDSELKNSLLQPEDLLFARQSLTIEGAGKCSLFIGDDEPYTFEGHLIRARVNQEVAFARYIYYYFNSFVGKSKIETLVYVTAAAGIRSSDLSNLKIGLPPLPTQRRIADILSALDEKIELNRQTNATLEALAQSIFREWFVEFNFPGATGVGADLKSARTGSLPQGWRVGKLGDFGDIVCGKTPSKANSNYFGGEIPFIKIPDMHASVFITKTEDSLTGEGAQSQKNKFIPPYSVIVSCIATVGLVAIASEKSQTNQQINAIVPNKEYFPFYLYFRAKELEGTLKDMGSGGSATLNVNTTSFSNIECVIPPDNTLKDFDKIVRPLFENILSNEQQSATLADLRDALLPKLMSGEVVV